MRLIYDVLRGALAKVLETTCDWKIGFNIFILDKFCRKCTCNIGDFKIMKHVYMLNTITLSSFLQGK